MAGRPEGEDGAGDTGHRQLEGQHQHIAAGEQSAQVPQGIWAEKMFTYSHGSTFLS